MFKAIIVILVISFTTILHGQEFSPHIKIEAHFSNYIEGFSGVVIEKDDTQISVLTCWHALMGIEKPKLISGKIIKAGQVLETSFTIVKEKPEHDLMLLNAKIDNLNVTPLKIASKSTQKEIGVSFGYAATSIVPIANEVSNIKYNAVINQKEKFYYLSANGQLVFGMSGGAVVVDNLVYGIQSAGKENEVLFIPESLIVKFLNE